MFEDIEVFGGDFDVDAVVVATGFINAVFLLSVREDFIAESEDVAILVGHFLKVLFAEFQNGFSFVFAFFVGTIQRKEFFNSVQKLHGMHAIMGPKESETLSFGMENKAGETLCISGR